MDAKIPSIMNVKRFWDLDMARYLQWLRVPSTLAAPQQTRHQSALTNVAH